MEHQSAVTYGNRFANGYLGRDWTGVGISPTFDFIIVHESAHEWFGNSVTASDMCDEWIHEAWGTYLEGVYVEHVSGKADALKYLNGYRSKVRNREPIIPPCGVNRTPPQDMYFKGALFLNTLRSVVDDDERWWALVRRFYDRFKYRAIATDDVVRFFDEETGKPLTPLFEQYLRHAAIPVLELQFHETDGSVSYRWKADVPEFAMPVKVGTKDAWKAIQPTAEWQTMPWPAGRDAFDVATDLYFIDVEKSGSGFENDLPRDDGLAHVQVGSEKHQVGEEAWRDLSALAIQAEEPRGRGGHHRQGVRQRACRDLDDVAQGLIERQDAAPEHVVREAGARRVHDDVVVAQSVDARAHAQRRHRVGDEAHPARAERPVDDLDDRPVRVDPVGDEPDGDAVVRQQGAGDARLAVPEAGLRVEEVRAVACAGVEARDGLFVRGVGVPHAHHDPARGKRVDHLERARQLRRHGDQSHAGPGDHPATASSEGGRR